MKRITVTIVILITLLTGCSLSDSAPIVQPTDAPIPVIKKTMEITKATFTISAPVPSATAYSQIKTDVPTLSKEELLELVYQNEYGDSSCDLPCWWGVEPGDYLLDNEVLSFRNQIDYYEYYNENVSQFVSSACENCFGYTLYTSEFSQDVLIVGDEENNIDHLYVQYSDLNFAPGEKFLYKHPNEILEKYGVPFDFHIVYKYFDDYKFEIVIYLFYEDGFAFTLYQLTNENFFPINYYFVRTKSLIKRPSMAHIN